MGDGGSERVGARDRESVEGVRGDGDKEQGSQRDSDGGRECEIGGGWR